MRRLILKLMARLRRRQHEAEFDRMYRDMQETMPWMLEGLEQAQRGVDPLKDQKGLGDALYANAPPGNPSR